MSNDKIPLHEEEYFEKLAIKIFSDIENLTKDKIGISRESYGRGETLGIKYIIDLACLLYTSPSPRDPKTSRMPSSA